MPRWTLAAGGIEEKAKQSEVGVKEETAEDSPTRRQMIGCGDQEGNG